VADLLRARRDVAVVATSSSAEEEAILRGLCGVAFAFKLEAEAMDLACRRFRITARERQVLAELCRGSSYRDISARLSIAEGTVQTHVKRIYEKLGVRSKLDALRVVRGQAPQGADRQNAQLGS
jgi:LuxR family maltose regulon positive regulatory protein